MNPKFKINNQINAEQLMIIDENGSNLGIKPRDEALSMAREKNLDLIEISPNTNPPVAKIMDYDKFRYQQEKEEKKKRHQQTTGTLKQVRITAKAAENDLNIRARQVEEFLEKGHKVEIDMVLRGREKYNKSWAMEKFKNFLQLIKAEYKITSPEKFGGRGIFMQISRK